MVVGISRNLSTTQQKYEVLLTALHRKTGHAAAQLVEALLYTPEDLGSTPDRVFEIFHSLNPSGRWGRLSL
jgi:hypothetical protein